jgi:hypothetical protein
MTITELFTGSLEVNPNRPKHNHSNLHVCCVDLLNTNRHVRLKKNFVNRETIPHVGVKLRIPEVLLVEKMRTQQRFNVSSAPVGSFYIY